jgi:hypothetical protein
MTERLIDMGQRGGAYKSYHANYKPETRFTLYIEDVDGRIGEYKGLNTICDCFNTGR